MTAPDTSARRSPAAVRRPGLSLFRIAGIEIRLDYTWFLLFALLLVSLAVGYFPRLHPGLPAGHYWIAGTAGTLLLFGSILAHELSHALCARRSGIPVPSITLFLFGGASEAAHEPKEPATELGIAVVGPLTSFALGAAFYGLHAVLAPVVQPLTAGTALYLAWINVALGVFNLLPGLPLDGGRILRALAWWRTGSRRRATRIASRAGKGIGVGLMVLGALQIFAGGLVGGLWLILIGLFLRATAEADYQALILRQSLEDVRVGDVALLGPVVHVSPQTSLQELVDDYILRHGQRAYPVVEGDSVLGMISIDALRDVPAAARAEETVKQHLTPLADELTVDADLPLDEALARLARTPAHHLLVMQRGALAGVLTHDGLMRFIEIRRVLEESEPERRSDGAGETRAAL